MRDGKASLFVVSGVVAAAALTIGVTLTVAPQHAQARPEYAAKEGKACGYCHVNPAGGGPRNATGQRYEKNGHSFGKK